MKALEMYLGGAVLVWTLVAPQMLWAQDDNADDDFQVEGLAPSPAPGARAAVPGAPTPAAPAPANTSAAPKATAPGTAAPLTAAPAPGNTTAAPKAAAAAPGTAAPATVTAAPGNTPPAPTAVAPALPAAAPATEPTGDSGTSAARSRLGDLNLSSEQTAAIVEMRRQWKAEQEKRVKDELKAAKLDFFQAMSDTTPAEEVKKKFELVQKRYIELQTIKFERSLKIREVLSAEQRKKFQQLRFRAEK